MLSLVSRVTGIFTRKNEEGATMVEYGLMVALIAVVVAVAATLLGTSISTLFADVAGKL